MWIVFFLGAVAFGIWYVVDKFRPKAVGVKPESIPPTANDVSGVEELWQRDMNSNSGELSWDPQQLERKIRNLAATNNIAALEHLIKSLRVRIIMGQDARTALKSTQVLRALLERLGVIKLVRVAYEDLRLYDKELDIRVKNLDIEKLEKDLRIQDLEHQKATRQKINDLKCRTEELEQELRIARLKRDIHEVQNPPPPPAEAPPPPRAPTAKEQRTRERAESEERIKDLKREKAAQLARLQAEGASEEEIRRAENMWDDAIAREEERLAKLL